MSTPAAAHPTGHGALTATATPKYTRAATLHGIGTYNTEYPIVRTPTKWWQWPYSGAPHHWPAPAGAHVFAGTSGNGTLAATIKVIPTIPSLGGIGTLSLAINFQLQHSTPHPRGTGMLVAANHTTVSALHGTGALSGTAVATIYQLPWGVPTLAAPPTTIFANLPATWQGLETKVIWIGADGSYWNLAGNYAGREGLTLAPHVAGLMHAPFESIFSEGPYMIGAHYERTDYKKRELNFGVQVGIDYGPDTSSWRYRLLEQKWWRSWSPSQTGCMCVFTRTHGWRFMFLQLGEHPKTPIELDPVAFDNNFMQWDIVAVGAQPFWTRKMVTDTWRNDPSTSTPQAGGALGGILTLLENLLNPLLGGLLQGAGGVLVPGNHVGKHTFSLWNNGDFPAWPKFIIGAPGVCWIQDGPGGNMLQLPNITTAIGPILVDTDPTARTISSATDPNDPLLYEIVTASDQANLVLNPQAASSQKGIWSQFKYFFTTPMPSHAQSQIQVYHSDPNGYVIMYVPQQFDKAYA